MRHPVLAALVLGLLNPVPLSTKEAAVRKEQKKLQGTWELVSMEMNGSVTAQPKGQTRLVIHDNNRATIRANGVQPAEEVGIEFDPTTDPKTYRVDRKSEEGTRTTVGIYQLKGDTLRLCRTTSGEKHPTDLSGGSGADQYVLTYRRLRP